MPTYDRDAFVPPAPIAHVTLRNRANGKQRHDVAMLIDTGADVTLVPKAVLAELELNLIPESQYELVGFDGASSFAAVVQLELIFCQRSYKGQFLVSDQPWGILGRNILNTVRLLFDGPQAQWQEARLPKAE